MDDKERTPLSLLLLILAEEESVLEEYEIQCPDGDATVGDVENRGEEKEPLATDEWHPLRPERVYEREIQHVHDPAEHEGSIIEDQSIEKAVYYVSESSRGNQGKTEKHAIRDNRGSVLEPGQRTILIPGLLDQGGDPPAEGGKQSDPEEREQEFSDRTAELHPESHAFVLNEQDLEPVAYDIDVLSKFHVCLDQDLYDLVNDNKQNSKQKEFISFRKLH